MKKYVTLNKKWKEILFAASGFGPNLLMILMGAYFTDAVNPAALPEGSFQAIGVSCYILPLVFPVLWALVYYNSFNTWGWLDTLSASVMSHVEIFQGDIRDPHGVKEEFQLQYVLSRCA